MKKLLIFILIVGAIFIAQDKEKYFGIINEKIDLIIPQHIQDITNSSWAILSNHYLKLEARADVWRGETKEWSLQESTLLVQEISGTDFVPNSNSFSPILDNSSTVFSGSSSLLQKLYAVFLFVTTLLFWNFKIFAVWLCLIAYFLLRSLKKQFFPKRKKNFFDKINENVKKEIDSDWN